MTEVRNWINSLAHLQAPGPARVWTAFLEFMSDNYDALKKRGFSDHDVDALPVYELINCIDKWVAYTK